MAKMKKLKVFSDPKSAKRKKKSEIELTDKCDQCGEYLGRMCARTVNSSVCATAEEILSMNLDSGIKYFCCGVCFNDFWSKVHESI